MKTLYYHVSEDRQDLKILIVSERRAWVESFGDPASAVGREKLAPILSFQVSDACFNGLPRTARGRGMRIPVYYTTACWGPGRAAAQPRGISLGWSFFADTTIEKLYYDESVQRELAEKLASIALIHG